MHGLLKAALLLAPALASTLVVPEAEVQEFNAADYTPIADHSFALVSIEVPTKSRSPDEWDSQVLGFRIDVLKSEAACGFGNLTINGQLLPQGLEDNVMTGKGPISTERKGVVVASWQFHCINVNGQPEAQLLKLVVDLVDGKAMRDVGFSVAFKQTGATEIINIETDLSVPDEIVANPNPEGLQPVGGITDSSHYDIEEDIAALQWMRAQLEELHFLIAEKEQTIAQHMSDKFHKDIKDCDNLRCVMKAIAEKATRATRHIYGKLGGDEEIDGGDHGHFPKPPHWKLPKDPFHHGPKGNHTDCPPKHGKGNHTHPGPPFKRPHFGHKPLPICRYPPPPPHHRKPPGGHPGDHRPEPPHGPPHHGPGHDGPPPPPPPPPPHHGPEHGGPPPPPPPPPHNGRPGPPPDHSPPGPPPDHYGPEDEDRPHHPPHYNDPGPPGEFDEQQEHLGPPPGEDFPPPPPPHFDQFGGPPGHGPGKAPIFLKFTAIGILLAFLLVAIRRRSCNSGHKKSRRERREERQRRRAYRRAAKKHSITRFLSRFSPSTESEDEADDYEEKREELLADEEDRMSTTMTEEITEIRNAASIVEDIVAAEEGRAEGPVAAMPIPISEASSLVQDFDIGSQVGDGEELPAYEDNDGSEDSSFIADGFRYTPGSSEYSPAHSASGS
ncbi:hypothetical protein LOCC1_G005215, partial [Lachnellula occidentalis]